MPNDNYDDLFDAAGKAYNVDPQLTKTVFHLESSGNPNTPDSPQGAEGGMQMLPSTAAALGVTDPRNMRQAIPAATAYLAQGLQATGTPEGALAYYHGGPDTSQWGPKTAAYVAKGERLYSQVPLVGGAQPQQQQPQAQPVAAVLARVPIAHADEQFPPAAAPASTPSSQTGAPPVASSQAASNPGEDILSAYAAPVPTAPAPAAANGNKPAVSNPGEDILSAYNQGDAPAVAQASQQTASAPLVNIPVLHNFAAGATHGAQQVVNLLQRGAAYVDNNVPALAALDKATGIDPVAQVAAQPSGEAAYQKQYGNSLAADAGDIAGKIAVTSPALTGAGAALGAAGGALAEGIGGAATGVGRGIQAGVNMLAGTASAPEAGVAANALARGTSLAVNGGLQGAGYGALTGGNIQNNALAGAVLGPAAGAVAAGATGAKNALASGGNVVLNKLIPSRAAAGIEAEIDAAVARSKGVDANQLAAGATAPVPPADPAAPAQTATPAAAQPANASSQTGDMRAPTAAPVQPVTETPLPPPTPSNAPASAGSAATTPADLTANAMTPAQEAASRATGFNYRMAQQANTKFDDATYVPGSKPTIAETSADPALAAQQRVLANGNPEAANLDRANNEARLDYFDSLAGTPTTVQTLQAARSAQAQTDLNAAFQNKGTADAQPVVDQINSVLAGPDGKRAAVASTLNNVAGALQKADGSGLENDPQMLYGVRQHITDLMSKQGQMDNPMAARATAQLQGVKDALDAAIEPAAPGYQQYLRNYAAASKPIDTQELLQSYRPNLMDAKGNIQLSRVNTMMKSVGQNLTSTGVNPAKSLDDDTVNGLFNLRQDLLRQENRNLARPAGSDTAHNLSVMSQLGENTLMGGAHALAAHVPGGNLALGAVLNKASQSSNAVVQRTLANRLFTPVETSGPPGGAP